MVNSKSGEFRRILCKIAEVKELSSMEIQLSQKALEILKTSRKNLSSNYGTVTLNCISNPKSDFDIIIDLNLTQKFGIDKGDFVEILNNDESLFFIPLLKTELRSFFYTNYGAENPRVILLSSHAEFEPFTREIATQIYHRLEASSIPSQRIAIRERVLDWKSQINATISRYEVDITRIRGIPEKIGTKLVNKNLSYRILSEIYFQLISQYLSSEKRVIVVDIHGIATRSSTGIIHPMVIIGDAFLRSLLVKKFTDTIFSASKILIPNLWIVYRTQWGAVEHSLQLVKKAGNIPIIIEVRRDLREQSETRDALVNLISEAIKDLVKYSDLYIFEDKKIIYRKFLESDLENIRKIYIKAFEWLYGNQTDEYAELFLKLFRTALKINVKGELFVAEKNSRIKAFAVIHQEPNNTWKFGPIVVVPRMQRKGIGIQLLRLCIDFARSQGVEQIYLQVHEHNRAAINLYTKFGFTITQSVPSNIPDKKYLKMTLNLKY
ncbi:MAG: GNAT family N-acetyltransferase [Candidatus Helarchaeota archaeon]